VKLDHLHAVVIALPHHRVRDPPRDEGLSDAGRTLENDAFFPPKPGEDGVELLLRHEEAGEGVGFGEVIKNHGREFSPGRGVSDFDDNGRAMILTYINRARAMRDAELAILESQISSLITVGLWL
jgi:hypothetical protein